jgi:hypothetical protein
MDEHTFAIAFIRTMGAVLAVVAWQVLAAARERSRQHPDTEAAVLELAQRVEEVERLEAPSGRCSRGDALGNIHPPTILRTIQEIQAPRGSLTCPSPPILAGFRVPAAGSLEDQRLNRCLLSSAGQGTIFSVRSH